MIESAQQLEKKVFMTGYAKLVELEASYVIAVSMIVFGIAIEIDQHDPGIAALYTASGFSPALWKIAFWLCAMLILIFRLRSGVLSFFLTMPFWGLFSFLLIREVQHVTPLFTLAILGDAATIIALFFLRSPVYYHVRELNVALAVENQLLKEKIKELEESPKKL